MNKLAVALVAAALMCVSSLTLAHDGPHGMAAMDTNGDGMISKEEFMKFHESMWDKLPKNKDGMVAMKDMESMHHDKMGRHDAMKKDGGGN